MPTAAGRVLFVLSRGLLVLVLTLLVQGVWAALVVQNLRAQPALPWAVPVMALVLWLGWRYLGGAGWPRSTSAGRA